MAGTDLLELAERVSDGRDVDWDGALRDLPRDARRVVRNLRLVESLSSFHRSEPGSARGAVDETHTLHEGAGPGARSAIPGLEGVEPGVDSRASGRDAADRAPLTPFRWGSLEVLARLGEGGFGEVFRAWDSKLERHVALKLLKPGAREGDELAARVLHEGRLLARVRHANVVAVHGADVHEGRVGLWMELVQGRSLARWIEEHGRMGAREAAVLGVELCGALAAVHRAGLVHRDIKASNVMREEGGRILLMDFGAGTDLSTATDTISGTPGYMAPEMLEGGESSPRSDLYSLGVLLYHLVTGRYPVEAETMRELREKMRRRAARLLRDERPDLPGRFVQVVERACAWEPEARYATAGQMEQALSAFLGADAAAAVGDASPPSSVAESRERSRGDASPRVRMFAGLSRAGAVAVAAAGIGVVVILGVAAFLVLNGPRSGGGDGTAQAPQGDARGQSDGSAGPSSPGSLSEPGGRFAAAPATPQAKDAASAGSAEKLAPAGGSIPAAANPYTVEAALWRIRRDGTRNRLESGAKLALRDDLSLEFRASIPLYVYVIDEDERGHAFVLFPLPGRSAQNPLAPGTLHHLPGSDEQGVPDYWTVDTAGGREHILILASPDRLVEFEADMGRLARPRSEASAVEIPESTKVRLRGIGALTPAPVASGASGPQTGAGSLFEMAERLAGSAEVVRGPWLRRIDLENPAP